MFRQSASTRRSSRVGISDGDLRLQIKLLRLSFWGSFGQMSSLSSAVLGLVTYHAAS